MITVAKCIDIIEANRLRMALESAGIAVFMPDEMTASVASHWFLNSGGIRLQVADEHAGAARRVIDEENDVPRA